MASAAIEVVIQWVPFLVGMTNAGLMSYYANKFPSGDIDTNHGTITGTAGSAMLGLSSATIAVEAWGIFEFFKYIIKREEGKVTTQNRNAHYDLHAGGADLGGAAGSTCHTV